MNKPSFSTLFSHHTSRLTSSKIKSIASDSELSPRRSTLPSHTSKISSTSEDEIQLDPTSITSTSSTGVTAEEKKSSEVLRDSVTSPVMEASLIESLVSTTSTVTEEKKDIGPVVDSLVNKLVDDIILEMDDKSAVLRQLQSSASGEDEGEYFDTYFGFDLEGRAW